MQIDLRKVNHIRKQRRFYLLGMGKTLFGQIYVIREWGRIGQPGKVRRDYFDSIEKAEAHALRLKHQKERGGYVTLAQQKEMDL